MRPSNPANDGGDVAIEVEETRGRHGFPVLSNGCDLIPVGLEALEGAEVNGGVFFAELLKLPDSKGSALELFDVVARNEAALENGENDVSETFFRQK